MKLIDALKQVDKSEKNSTTPDFQDFCDELGIQDYSGWNEKFNERVKGYYVQKWLCTDTWVGLIAYYFDGELVAGSFQSARKSDTNYEFVSKELAYKVINFIISIIEQEEPNFNIIDENEEIEDTYSLDFGGQILIKSGFYDDLPCKVVKMVEDKYHLYEQIEVKFEDGSNKVIATNNFKIPLSLHHE
ncbi:MAG: hypothetical protein ACXVC7_17005 [Bacteroidia bacterium]